MTTVHVHGRATATELAAVLAVLRAGDTAPRPGDFEQWQALRQAAIRPQGDSGHGRQAGPNR